MFRWTTALVLLSPKPSWFTPNDQIPLLGLIKILFDRGYIQCVNSSWFHAVKIVKTIRITLVSFSAEFIFARQGNRSYLIMVGGFLSCKELLCCCLRFVETADLNASQFIDLCKNSIASLRRWLLFYCHCYYRVWKARTKLREGERKIDQGREEIQRKRDSMETYRVRENVNEEQKDKHRIGLSWEIL